MRMIDADALKEKIDSMWNGRPLSSLGARILVTIDEAPTIDADRPQGEWKMEQVEDEFKQFDREDLILLIECQKERIAELLAKDEPTWEQVKEYCNKRCLDIVDSAMRKQWYKDEPQTETSTNTEKVQLKVQLTDEPQTDCAWK